MSIFGLNKPLSEYTFTVVDTETTGLSPYKGAELLEISAVKVKNGLQLDMDSHFTTLIKPKRNIPEKTIKINGIDENVVKDAPFIEDVLPEFVEFVENTVFVAHNAKFDFMFINYYMKKYCLDCKLIHIIDTVSITKKFYPNLSKYNLDFLIKHFDINIDVKNSMRHRALFDALNTSVVFLKNIERMKMLNIDMTLANLL